MPAATEQALGRLLPTGAKEAGGAQVIRVGEAANVEGYKATAVEGADFAALAQAIDRLHDRGGGQAVGGGRDRLRGAAGLLDAGGGLGGEGAGTRCCG